MADEEPMPRKGPLSAEEWIAKAMLEQTVRVALPGAAVTKLRDALGAALDIHQPFAVYEPCDHRHRPGDDGVEDIDEVGLVCDEGLQGFICTGCCMDWSNGQSEDCAGGHEHRLWGYCRTVGAVAQALLAEASDV